MKCPGNLTYLRLKIDTVKKYSSGADLEIVAGEGSTQDMIFLQAFLYVFPSSLIALGATSNQVLL